MKSAYEIAMERMARESGPSKTLSEDQKARVAKIESKYAAKIAEVELGYEAKLATPMTWEDFERLKAAMASEIQSLESKRDQEKDEVWEEA